MGIWQRGGPRYASIGMRGAGGVVVRGTGIRKLPGRGEPKGRAARCWW